MKTVCNALAWLAAWGFLSWKRRLKRVPTGLGVMVRQTSNAYRIALSGLAAIGSAMFSRGADGNNSTPSRVIGFRSSIFSKKIDRSRLDAGPLFDLPPTFEGVCGTEMGCRSADRGAGVLDNDGRRSRAGWP